MECCNLRPNPRRRLHSDQADNFQPVTGSAEGSILHFSRLQWGKLLFPMGLRLSLRRSQTVRTNPKQILGTILPAKVKSHWNLPLNSTPKVSSPRFPAGAARFRCSGVPVPDPTIPPWLHDRNKASKAPNNSGRPSALGGVVGCFEVASGWKQMWPWDTMGQRNGQLRYYPNGLRITTEKDVSHGETSMTSGVFWVGIFDQQNMGLQAEIPPGWGRWGTKSGMYNRKRHHGISSIGVPNLQYGFVWK